MKTSIISLPLLFLAAYASPQSGKLDGLCGERLKAEINLTCRPSVIISAADVPGALAKTFPGVDGSVYDPFSAQASGPVSGRLFPKGMTSVNILPTEWWNGEYGDAPRLDLHNLAPAAESVPPHKKDYPPGNVTKILYSNSVWASGTGLVDGIAVNFYRPPEGYEGDFARMAFYTLCIYPRERWSGLGCNFCTDNIYPGLRRDAFRTLKAWSDSDPVDKSERDRNDAVESIQKNRNPFVDHPEIADHIWGEKAGTPYDSGGKDVYVYLRGRYSVTDAHIDLRSPYVPDGARWWIDGTETRSPQIRPSDLGQGLHELKFKAGELTGKLLIMIAP